MEKAVVGIVNYKGMVLIGKKDQNRNGLLKGKWHIPGETIKNGETDVEALLRCFKEEAGIKIVVGSYLTSYKTQTHSEVRWYECFTSTYDVKPGDDLIEVKWVPRKEVLKYCDKESVELLTKEVLD